MIRTYNTLEYLGATLEMPSWLMPLWPVDMPLAEWPTFCGAGGIGDILVPDDIIGVHISPACFIHDIDFATLPREWWPFQQANNRLYSNIVALVESQITDAVKLKKAKRSAMRYWIGVSVFGWRHFTPESGNPWQNSTVRDRLNRLAKARYGIK